MVATSAGVAVHDAILRMAKCAGLVFRVDKWQNAHFGGGVSVDYDASDAFNDPGCSEFLYIRRNREQLAEGFINPDGSGAWFRVDLDSTELRMTSGEALAGFMFARLLEALKAK